ncbi:hypothetical protein JYU34_008809 [Plutella xylostella]|uniref:Uncharacterized protein n=1 Tax=Plutella xylostella TaxID=51655 RepID=A0ABQ7QLZ3_PLUXY|nr:hypothetical protein JYU34_008809 [Plutella xylostella]
MACIVCGSVQRCGDTPPESATDAPPAPVCVLCNGSHRIYDCASFLAMSVEDRCSEAARLRLCANCLRSKYLKRKYIHHRI